MFDGADIKVQDARAAIRLLHVLGEPRPIEIVGESLKILLGNVVILCGADRMRAVWRR